MFAITGATGLVGSHLLYLISQKGFEIKAIYRDEAKIEKIKRYFEQFLSFSQAQWQLIDWQKVDIRDYTDLAEAFSSCEAVFHTAAFVSFRKADRKLMKEINTEGTVNVVNACLAEKVPYLVHLSSVSALDNVITSGKITEKFTSGKTSDKLYYGKTKAEAEMEVFRGIAEGLKAAMINPVIILGYSPFKQSSANLFYQIQDGLPVYSPGATDFVSVWDVVEILWKLFENKISGERFIVSGEHWNYKDLLQKIAKELEAHIPKYQIPLVLAKTFAFLSEKISPKTTNLNVESVRAAYEEVFYDNSKIVEKLNYSFRSIEKKIEESARIYNKIKL